jgi:energy-coupling factor transporter ATP-binding protein EcfA2
MLIDFSKQMDKLNDVRSGKFKEGLSLGVPGIDEYLRFKPGNFNVILGHANVGKTTVVLYLMLLYTMKHGIRWLVFSSENESYSIIKKLIEFMEQQPINKIDQEVYKKQAAFIESHFKFVDCEELFTFDKLLKLAENIKDAWDYKGFLLDPYNSLIKNREVLKGISSHEYDYEATSRMRMFCKNKGVSIWLNTHASTEALRKKHSKEDFYAGHPIPPMASDVEGGGKFVNRADDFLVIHRYIQHPQDWMQSHIHVRKVKDIDTGGRPTPMDEPIRLRSIKNNVGFTVNGNNPIKPETHKFKEEIPF